MIEKKLTELLNILHFDMLRLKIIELRNEIKINNSKRILFVCAYGESRSKYFAEKFMEKGFKAVFCKEDNIKDYIFWADIVVMLAEESFRDGTQLFLETLEEENKIKLMQFFIKDDKTTFEEKFEEFNTKFFSQKY